MRICVAVLLFAVCSEASAADRSGKIHDLMEAQGLVEMFQHQIDAGRGLAEKQADHMLEQVPSGLNPPEEVKAELHDAVREFIKAARSPWTAQDVVDVIIHCRHRSCCHQGYGRQACCMGRSPREWGVR